MTGDGAGVLHIMDLPRNLRRRVPSEVNTMQAFLMRQLARLDYLQACKPRRAQLLKVTPPLLVCMPVLSITSEAAYPRLCHSHLQAHYSKRQPSLTPSASKGEVLQPETKRLLYTPVFGPR